MSNPDQPFVADEKGYPRFKENKIVRYLYEQAQKTGCDMNQIWGMVGGGTFSEDDLHQFNQLLGYSLGGYCELDLGKSTAYLEKRAIRQGFRWQGHNADKWPQEDATEQRFMDKIEVPRVVLAKLVQEGDRWVVRCVKCGVLHFSAAKLETIQDMKLSETARCLDCKTPIRIEV